MKTINAIILAVVVMFVACAQPPVAPSINVSVRILQEQATSDPDSDPDLFVSPTNFDLGKVNRSSSFVITNQGGGEMSYNVTNSSSRVTMAGSLSGTLGAGKNVEISFSVNAGTVADSAKVHVTSGSNEKVVRISWDVADEALDNWYVVPVKDAAVVRGDKGMEGKIYPCVERFQVASPGVYRFKGIQVDDSNSYEQLDESWFIGVKDHTTGKYARCTNATITSNVDGHGMLDVFPVIDFERHYSGPRNADCGEFSLQVDHEYEVVLFHAVLIRDSLDPKDIHQDFQGPQSVKVATFLAKEK